MSGRGGSQRADNWADRPSGPATQGSWAMSSTGRGRSRSSRSPPARLHPPAFGHVPEDQDDARDPPPASRIGAALSSIGRSVPSLAIRTVWLARPTTAPSRSTLATGFSTGRRVSSSTMRKTASSGRPAASAAASRSAPRRPGSAKSTRPSASVAMTASPMLARVTRSRSRCSAASAAFVLGPPPGGPQRPARAGRSQADDRSRGPARPGSRPWTARRPGAAGGRGRRRRRGRRSPAGRGRGRRSRRRRGRPGRAWRRGTGRPGWGRAPGGRPSPGRRRRSPRRSGAASSGQVGHGWAVSVDARGRRRGSASAGRLYSSLHHTRDPSKPGVVVGPGLADKATTRPGGPARNLGWCREPRPAQAVGFEHAGPSLLVPSTGPVRPPAASVPSQSPNH